MREVHVTHFDHQSPSKGKVRIHVNTHWGTRDLYVYEMTTQGLTSLFVFQDAAAMDSFRLANPTFNPDSAPNAKDPPCPLPVSESIKTQVQAELVRRSF